MLVEGAVLDSAGARNGYVRFRMGRVVETGALGTDSARGRERKIRGIVVPRPVNSHTHLGDAVFGREPPLLSAAQIVRPPHGIKFRILSETPPPEKVAAIRQALVRMRREGTGAVVDFREEGLPGVRLLRRAARGIGIRVLAFGRPSGPEFSDLELDRLLTEADGIGISAAKESPRAERERLIGACRRHGKRFALHASETSREPTDAYLRPRPDLLVHLTRATPDDLHEVAEAKVPVAVCARSNALFGRRPDLARFQAMGVRTLIGTDNAMFHHPSVFRELEFDYVSARLARRPVSPEFLFRAAFVEPWKWLRMPEAATVRPGMPVPPLVLRLPTEAPTYQVVTRVTEHVILQPERQRE